VPFDRSKNVALDILRCISETSSRLDAWNFSWWLSFRGGSDAHWRCRLPRTLDIPGGRSRNGCNAREQLLQINFRILVPQLPCEFASIDVWDYMGNNKLDISENIHKTIVTGPGGEQIVGVWEDGMARGTGYSQDEVKAKIGIQESTKLNQADFSTSLAANNWSFVDFYAPWCIHWYVQANICWKSPVSVALFTLLNQVHLLGKLTKMCLVRCAVPAFNLPYVF
jgi:hypothetical protein